MIIDVKTRVEYKLVPMLIRTEEIKRVFPDVEAKKGSERTVIEFYEPEQENLVIEEPFAEFSGRYIATEMQFTYNVEFKIESEEEVAEEKGETKEE